MLKWSGFFIFYPFSVYLSISLSIHLAFSLSLSASVSLCLFPTPPHSLCLSVSLFLSHSNSNKIVFISFILYSQSFFLPMIYFRARLSICVCLAAYQSICLFVCLSVSLDAHVSHSIYQTDFPWFCLSFLSLFSSFALSSGINHLSKA